MAFGEGCKAEEGWAGRLFRLMLEQQKIYVASGHTHETDHLPQSTGTHEDDRLRHHPSVVMRSPSHVPPLFFASGRTVQLAKVRRPLDHDTLSLSKSSTRQISSGPKLLNTPEWDVDFLGLAARTGFRRREFAARIEEVVREAKAKTRILFKYD